MLLINYMKNSNMLY